MQIASVDQSRDSLEGNKTVWEQVSDGFEQIKIGNYEVPSRSYVGRFNFKGADQQKFVKDLSGGERGRLHLALTLKQGGNVLLLDEPSNDLDVETLRALEEALLDFPGSAIVISHDRWFLDRIATHILSYEDDGKVTFFEGNYTEFEADREAPGRRRGPAAPRALQETGVSAPSRNRPPALPAGGFHAWNSTSHALGNMGTAQGHLHRRYPGRLPSSMPEPSPN